MFGFAKQRYKMTVGEFVQTMVLILCLMATGIVLPVGLVAGSASHGAGDAPFSADPVIVFIEVG